MSKQALQPLGNLGRRIKQWCALEPWERRSLITFFLLLPATWLVLLLFGFNKTRRMAAFELPTASKKIDQTSMERAQQYARLISTAARHGVFKATCLHQSLALCWVLRREGFPAQIRIGVRPNIHPFQAHAWVELDGIPLGQVVAEYKAFDQLTADPGVDKFV